MSEYSSCLFQGYGVLADPPSKLRTVAKTDSFVILDWNKPKRLADTVSTFHVKFRRLGVGDDYLTVEKVNLTEITLMLSRLFLSLAETSPSVFNTKFLFCVACDS